MGGVVTGGVIILALAFLTPLFKYVPKSALSAVIISAVIQMVDYEVPRKFWRIESKSTNSFVSPFRRKGDSRDRFFHPSIDMTNMKPRISDVLLRILVECLTSDSA